MILKPIFEKLFKIREDANRQREQSLRPGADDGYDPYEKPFLDHLEDLRKTIGKMLMVVMVATILAFAFNKQIFAFALLPLTIDLLGLSDGPPLREFIQFLTLSPQEILMLSIKVAFFAGLIGSFPILVYFAGEFILPGLKQQEKKYVIPGVGVGFMLFLTGASFAFFLAAPIALKFFYEFQLERVPMLNPAFTANESQTLSVNDLLEGGAEALEAKPGEGVEIAETPAIDPDLKKQVISILRGMLATPQDSELSITYDVTRERFIFSNTPVQMVSYRIGDYINFITRLTLVFGLSFQLPVVVVILVKLQLLTARVMRSTRAYAWVIMLVASAIFTPPDIFTLALLAGPLILLYEICIWIATAMEYSREKRERAEEESRKTRLQRLYEKPADDLTEEEKEELHRHEIEQYEKEHAGLYEEESSHLEHDPHGHDESWHDDYQEHDEYGHPIDPDHGHEHDPHHGEEPHEPIKDWPDSPEDQEHGPGVTESDHVEGYSTEEKPSADHEESTDDDHGFEDEEECEPSGPIVNLNSATEEELKTLPRIGPAIAKRIIENRPYETFDDVSKVPGLGEETLYAIMDRLSIDSVDEDDVEGEEEDQEPRDTFEP